MSDEKQIASLREEIRRAGRGPRSGGRGAPILSMASAPPAEPDCRGGMERDIAASIQSPAEPCRRGVQIRLALHLTNIGQQPLYLLRWMRLYVHVTLEFRDSGDQLYEYPGHNIRRKVAGPTDAGDFLRLESGYLFGTADCTEGEVVIPVAGTYDVRASYSDGGFAIRGRKLGVSAWSGFIWAPWISLVVE